MNYLLSLLFVLSSFTFSKSDVQNRHQEILQTIFDIDEFQKHLSYSPRFVGTNTKQEVLMLEFPELEDQEIELKVHNKHIRVVSEKQLKELEQNFFIKIDEFNVKNSEAKVLLFYQNARMYYEKRQKVMLDAKLEKTENGKWEVKNYKLDEVNINTSD